MVFCYSEDDFIPPAISAPPVVRFPDLEAEISKLVKEITGDEIDAKPVEEALKAIIKALKKKLG